MDAINRLLKSDAFGGIMLFMAAIFALLIQNSYFAEPYDCMLSTNAVVSIGDFKIDKPVLLWINDGLMVIFFLLVGIEVKREVLYGQLADLRNAVLPIVAAAGGLLVPAGIYAAFNYHDAQTIPGWAIPAATDIAFAFGVISLFGTRVPTQLKIILVTIAIVDDLAAIIIIAVFYTKDLSMLMLMMSSVAIAILAGLAYFRVKAISLYVVTGIALWAMVLKSGVHATLAGVILAMFLPTNRNKRLCQSYKMEKGLQPWVNLVVLPLFAFANSGIVLTQFSADNFLHPIMLGITLGLFIGKQVGVMLFSALFVALGFTKLPDDVNWRQYYGMALLTGIGFTMSLFIGTLAFDNVEFLRFVRLSVFIGSLLSGILGYMILHFTLPQKTEEF